MTIPSLMLAVSFLPFFEAKNTAAGFLVTPPPEGTSVTCERPSFMTRETCPACEGKGELILQEKNFGQADGRLGAGLKKRVKCAVCKGKRKLDTFLKPADLTLQVARDREKFVSDHQGRGEVPVGQAFVKPDDYEQIKGDRAKLKLIEEAYGKPCNACNWTGVEPCKKCDGNGTIPCPNDDCKGGWAVTKTKTSYTRTKSGSSRLNGGYNRGGFSSSGGSRRISRTEEKINVHVCPDCEGASLLLCPECQGRRAKPCRKCNGMGTKQKGYGL